MKINKLTKGLGFAALVALAGSVQAETVTVDASVQVDNAIDFTVAGAMNFGIVRATPNVADGECVGLRMPANPASPLANVGFADLDPLCTANTADVAIIQAVGGTPERPILTIQGVPAFSNMKLEFETDPIAMVTTAPAGSPTFTLTDLTAYKTSGTPGNIAIDPITGAGEVTVDAAGLATFTMGGTLLTHVGTLDPGANYLDSTYTGSFEVTVSY
jgi:hypothetical protein